MVRYVEYHGLVLMGIFNHTLYNKLIVQSTVKNLYLGCLCIKSRNFVTIVWSCEKWQAISWAPGRIRPPPQFLGLSLLITVRGSILSSQFWYEEKNTLIIFSFDSLYVFHSFSFAGKIMYYSCFVFMHYRPWQFYDVSYGQRIHFEFQRTQQLIN